MKKTNPSAALAAQLAALSALLAAPAFAQQPAPEGTRLKEVSVSATRTERNVDEVPATVTVIPGTEIERTMVRDIKDLIRYEPGVEVPSNTGGSGNSFSVNPNRPGNSGFNIRGVEGNRVQIVVDGVRLPDAFSFGSFAGPSRDLQDLDSLSRVEILRGPSSTLYGSDALGGVVSYTTYDPDELLRKLGGKTYFSLRGGYSSVDSSWRTNVGTALDLGNGVQAMLLVGAREGHETQTGGSNGAADRSAAALRTEANPEKYNLQNLLGKLTVRLGERDRLRFTVETRNQENAFNAQNAIGTITGSRFYSDLRGNDAFEHTRLAADWEHKDPGARFLHGIKLTFYGLHSNTLQTSNAVLNSNATGIVNRLRNLGFLYEQDTLGAQFQLETHAKWWGANHRLIYGVEHFNQKTAELRNGTEANGPAFIPVNCLGAAGTSCAAAVELYPTRDFPKSTTKQTSFFAQDEIQFGRLTLIPGLRHDRFELNPQQDAVFASGNPGITPQSLSFSSTTPKLGALWQLDNMHSLYAQVAKGFRAPPYNDVNIGFTNLVFGYTAVPNPNLKPETSVGYEVGWRMNTAKGNLGLAFFSNRYKDFIDSQVQLTCPGNPACSPLAGITFQSLNRAKVEIYGVEARGDYRLARDWTVRGAFAFAQGDDKSAGVPLNSIAPMKLVTGLQWKDKAAPYGAEGIVTLVDKKRRIDSSAYVAGAPAVAFPPFAPKGYAVFDLLGWWRPAKNVTVNAGVFNVFDKKYWQWNNVRLLSANAQNLDFFSSPGRNASVSAKVEF